MANWARILTRGGPSELKPWERAVHPGDVNVATLLGAFRPKWALGTVGIPYIQRDGSLVRRTLNDETGANCRETLDRLVTGLAPLGALSGSDEKRWTPVVKTGGAWRFKWASVYDLLTLRSRNGTQVQIHYPDSRDPDTTTLRVGRVVSGRSYALTVSIIDGLVVTGGFMVALAPEIVQAMKGDHSGDEPVAYRCLRLGHAVYLEQYRDLPKVTGWFATKQYGGQQVWPPKNLDPASEIGGEWESRIFSLTVPYDGKTFFSFALGRMRLDSDWGWSPNANAFQVQAWRHRSDDPYRDGRDDRVQVYAANAGGTGMTQVFSNTARKRVVPGPTLSRLIAVAEQAG